jgi:hypothetical protein
MKSTPDQDKYADGYQRTHNHHDKPMESKGEFEF